MAEHVGPIRVSLSGTPVENKLLDLHSQFEYILPGAWDKWTRACQAFLETRNGGTPIAGWFTMENSITMDDLAGTPTLGNPYML